MTACKKFKRGKTVTIEDLYQNKNFVPPKEQNLETIFEEPKQAKDGAPILTSVRKYKRYLDFDPITGKVRKPKKKTKQFMKKIKGKTRSASKKLQNVDISSILETLNDSSDECEMNFSIAVSECEDSDHVDENSVILPIANKIINHDNCSVKDRLPVTDKIVRNDDHFTKNVDLLCMKCTLLQKLCACDIVALSKVKEDSPNKSRQSKQTEIRTNSSLNPYVLLQRINVENYKI